MRYVTTIALVLLPCAGLWALFHYYGVWGPLVPFTLVFFERVMWKVLLRALWVLVLLGLLPRRTRHEYEDFVREAEAKFKAHFHRLEVIWKTSTWPVRALLTIVGAVVSGGCACALLLFPLDVPKLPYGIWLRDKGLPFLMRSATAKGIEANLPEGWEHVPNRVRRWLAPWYMHLWWWTARRLVRTRQALGRHSKHRRKRSAEK